MCAPIQRAWLFVHAITTVAILCVVAPFFFIMGPIVEGKYLPVTTDVKVVLLSTTGDKMVFQAYGNKVRDCKLVDVKTIVDVDGAGPKAPQKGVIYVEHDGIGDVVRPRGVQDLGIWAVYPSAQNIEVQTWYQCHPFWNTYTVLGTYPEAAQ